MNARRYRRPWQRVSLRTFLLVLIGGGVLFGITAKRAREQHRAVLATQSLGAVILYDTMRDELRKWNVINNSRSRNSVRPRFPAGPDFLKSQLSRSGVTAKKGLLRKLFGNDLFDTVVVVDLHNCNFAGEQLHYLSGFPRLEALYLNSSNVTDEDLAYLSGLSNLRTLALSSTEITDAGIEHLLKLKRLESVSLDRTYVTKHGIRKLQQEIPNCIIIQRDS